MTVSRGVARIGVTGLLLTVVVFGGCASAESRRTLSSYELQQLREDIAALERHHLSERERHETVVKRLEGLELQGATISHEIRQLATRLETAASELARVAGAAEQEAARSDHHASVSADRVETLGHEVQGLSERLTIVAEELRELTTRLAAPDAEQPRTSLPAAGKPLDQPAPTPSTQHPAEGSTPTEPRTPSASVAPAPEVAPGAGASDLYDAGYTEFGRGNYALAIGAFREFVRRRPDDELADNAQYWIAEAYLGLAHRYVNDGERERAASVFRQAIEAFRAVQQRYPHGDTVPVALFREAGIHFELGETDHGRARLQFLVEHFPSAPESRLARQRLAERDDP